MEEIISYIMETPENVNGNILREKLQEFKSSGGDDSVLDDLIEGKSGVHLVSNAESVGDAAFACFNQDGINVGLGWYLESVDLPNATSIGIGAFLGCSALTSVDLPNATSISIGAFDSISSTAVINLGAAEGEISGAPWGAPGGVTINYNVSVSTTE